MDPLIGTIIMFAGNFAPRGWALCDGQLMSIAQNSALFSILGTTYGGNGETTFGLPDLRGRFPLHPGNGPGLPPYQLGQKSGQHETVLSAGNLAPHTHSPAVTNDAGTHSSPGGHVAAAASDAQNYAESGASALSYGAPTSSIGSGQPFNNMPPFQGVNFIIALVGTFPSRN